MDVCGGQWLLGRARAGDGLDGDGEVTDWTGWSGGDGGGVAWRGEMHGQHSYL